LNNSVELNRRLNTELARFDVLALLRVLKNQGYEEQCMWFSSHNSLASPSRIIQTLVLSDTQEKKMARIELNLGLMSGGGLLPDYLRCYMNQANVDAASMIEFLQFFEHLLISHYLIQVYPEINADLFTDWNKSKQQFVVLQNMRSSCGVYWLFQTVFAEFWVVLQRKTLANEHLSSGIVMGCTTLGDQQTLGNSSHLSGEGFLLTLTLRECSGVRSFAWLQEVQWRIEYLILPFLNGIDTPFDIKVLMGASQHTLRLDGECVLGSHSLPGATDCEYKTPLYSGVVNLHETAQDTGISWGMPCRIHI